MLIIWMIGSHFFSDTKYFRSSDIHNFPGVKINWCFKSIICLIVILPLMVCILSFIWLLAILGLMYKISSVDIEMTDLCWYCIPGKLKIKWINYWISYKENKQHLIPYLEKCSEYIQEIIITDFISNKIEINEEDFNSIKNDILKWTYLNGISKLELKEWAENWLKIYITAERNRKINEILDLN